MWCFSSLFRLRWFRAASSNSSSDFKFMYFLSQTLEHKTNSTICLHYRPLHLISVSKHHRDFLDSSNKWTQKRRNRNLKIDYRYIYTLPQILGIYAKDRKYNSNTFSNFQRAQCSLEASSEYFDWIQPAAISTASPPWNIFSLFFCIQLIKKAAQFHNGESRSRQIAFQFCAIKNNTVFITCENNLISHTSTTRHRHRHQPHRSCDLRKKL